MGNRHIGNIVRVEHLPGGIDVASGGTRAGVKLNRPWQPDLSTLSGDLCPFEHKPQREFQSFWSGEWRALYNDFTPFDFHLLIIPGTCWRHDRLQALGGAGEIERALTAAALCIGASTHEFWFGVHVGPLAGQNLQHLHYHLLTPLPRRASQSRDIAGFFRETGKELFATDGFSVVVGGIRAGQCFVLPIKSDARLDQPDVVADLAGASSRLVELGNRRFRSSAGTPPHFMLVARLLGNRLAYATYIPILNNWGITEYLALLEGTPLILPWPHEDTAVALTT